MDLIPEIKYRLNNLYLRLRYGIRTTSVDVISSIVDCQDVYKMDDYDCSECGFNMLCFLDNRERFFRYLKRNDVYKYGKVKDVGNIV